MAQMTAATRFNKKRCIADSQDDVIEVSTLKRQITSSETGAPIQRGKTGRKRNGAVDVESDAVPRKLVRRDDPFPDTGFPRFPHGTVYIQLIEMHHKYTYIFEKALLSHCSSILACLLRSPVVEIDREMAEDMKKIARLEYFFDLTYFSHIDNWVVAPVSFTIRHPAEILRPQLSASVQPASMLTQSKASDLRAPQTFKFFQPLQNIESLTPAAATLDTASFLSVVPVKDTNPVHLPPRGIPTLTVSKKVIHSSNKSTTTTPPDAVLVTPAVAENKEDGVEIKLEESEGKAEIDECKLAEANNDIKKLVKCRAETKAGANDSIMEFVELTPRFKAEENGSIKEIIRPTTKEGLNDNVMEIVQPSELSVGMNIQNGKFNTQESTPTRTDNTVANAESIFHFRTEGGNGKSTTQESISTTTESVMATTKSIVDPAPIAKHSMELENGTSFTQECSSMDTNIKTPDQKFHVRYAHDKPPNHLMIAECKTSASNHTACSDEGRFEAVETHHNLFRLFHNLTPDFDANNINTALKQMEKITAIAKLYKCLPLIRHHLNNHLLGFGRDLFKSILEDPPRWILLSVELECALIFKEAIVHLVGYYPHYPWITTLPSKLPHAILNIIRKKVDDLNVLRASVDTDLFTSSIAINDQNLTFSTLAKSDFENWFIAQLWRDWFCHSLLKNATKYEVASTYRLIAKGGNTYLDRLTVYDCLIRYKGKILGSWNLNIVNEDLKIMKDYAQKIVKDLVVNNSMLDVEEAGIKHLTCTKVENDELPWVTNTKDGV